MSDLETQFAAAVNTVQNAEGNFKPSNELKLKMYALYKQATEGDVKGKCPGIFDLTGQAKWRAWEKNKGMAATDAMQEYVNTVNKIEDEQR